MNFPPSTPMILEIVYLAVTATAIGLELCAILNSACCSVFGPGKFLRGSGGLQSAEKAVQVLEDKSEITQTYFMTGLYCIVISSALKAFILYTLWNACIVAAGLGVMSYILVTSEKDQAIRGRINKDQVIDPTNIKLQ
ncbi:UNKNOWN [Stylonychia lemnae]|uniref:Copper transporter n=1 Tax=Stylonychia lemnae TaxID=5949 RepID=A0A078B3X1_STYLE|nr:UNKNOWN [Stylonychia lemnae]|eukprot:CDW89245.1 UNKNOWN [Stylonychia lemnae]